MVTRFWDEQFQLRVLMSQVVFSVSRIQIERSANSVNCMHKLIHLFARDGRGYEIRDISLVFLACFRQEEPFITERSGSEFS